MSDPGPGRASRLDPLEIGELRPAGARIHRIIVHCSASPWGDREAIHRWHLDNGWSGIGYHWVVLNGHRNATDGYSENLDGAVEPGRAEHRVGSHARGHNRDTLGVCLIGKAGHFGRHQIHQAVELVADACVRLGLGPPEVFGHCELPGVRKTCPELDMDYLRREVELRLRHRTCRGAS